MKNNNKILAYILTCSLAISALSGCSSSTNSVSSGTVVPNSTSTATENIVKGGTVTVQMLSDPTTIVAWDVRATQNIFWQSICQETLMVYDGNGNPQPWLIESIIPDAAALTYSMKIKEGIKFSDGSPLNAETVVWNLNKYKAEGVFASSLFANFDKAEAKGEYEVVCNFTAWDSMFMYTLARACCITSVEAYNSNGGDKDTNNDGITDGETFLASNPVGTGPFVLTDWVRDVSMTFTRNDNYWNGTATVDAIKYVNYAAELTAQAAMQTGELNAMSTTNFGLADQMASKGDYEINVASLPTSAYTLAFTSNDPKDPFYKADVRKAISYAIDCKTISDGLGYGYANVSNQWCMEGSEFYNSEIVGQPYNVETAKKMLADAGYPNGFETKLTVCNVTGYTDVCQVIIEQLSQIGVKVTLVPVETASYVNFIGAWDGGMILHPMGMENGAASQYASTFVQGLGFALGVNAFEHPDDLNTLLVGAQSAATVEERNNMVKKAAKLIIDDYCYMKVVEIVPTVGISKGVSNMDYCATYNLYTNFLNTALVK